MEIIKKIGISIKVEKNEMLHIGAAESLLSEKKGPIFKFGFNSVIPASTFKGALRSSMENLLIDKHKDLVSVFKIPRENVDCIRPCIPSSTPSFAEKSLIIDGNGDIKKKYRGKLEDNGRYEGFCEIKSTQSDIMKNNKLGICPICYFLGAHGIMGFLRIPNFVSEGEDNIMDQTCIRIDRATKTAADRAKVDYEHVKPCTEFKGNIEILNFSRLGFEFGTPRKIGDKTLDIWLKNMGKNASEELISHILKPAIENIKFIGGGKSKGAGKVEVSFEV